MRIAKKGLSLLLVLAMLAATVCIPAAAADSVAVTATSDKDIVLQGEQITITVKVGAIESIGGIQARLYYDPEKVEFVSAQNGDLGDKFTSAQKVSNEQTSEQHYIDGLYSVDDEGVRNEAEAVLYTATFRALVDSGSIAPTLGVELFYDGTADLVDIDYTLVQPEVTAVKDIVQITAASNVPTVPQMGTFTISVKVGAVDISSIHARLYYDPEKVEFVNAQNGDLGDKFTSMKTATNEQAGEQHYIDGLYAVDDKSIDNEAEAVLYTATFRALVDSGDVAPTLKVLKTSDGKFKPIVHKVEQATVTAKQAIMLGDVDGDGKVLPKDASFVLQYFVGRDVSANVKNMDAGDVNGDGKVDYKDASFILQYFVGRITVWPAEKQ